MPASRTQRPIRFFALLLIFVILLTILAQRPVSAATDGDSLSLDNSQGEFAGGVFQRTSIGPTINTATPGTGEIADAAGAVQLAPAGVLKAWVPFTPIVNASNVINVSNAGVTAIGNRIYVIGGSRSTGSYASDIYWADVDPQTGTLVGETDSVWKKNDTDLPATQVILDNDPIFADESFPELTTCKATPLSGRSRHSAVGLTTGTNTGYIYVIGGEFDTTTAGCPEDLSSAVVQRGTVAANGMITWTTLTNSAVPSPDTTRYLGVDGASSVIAQYRDSSGSDHYYLYVIGGRSHYLFGDSSIFFPEDPTSRILKSVYYTEIDTSTGNLIDPDTSDGVNGVWKRDTNIQMHALAAGDPLYPTLGTNDGLWDATASATAVTVDNQLKSAIFLAGGAHNVARTSIENFVYRADVGAKGALNWGTSDANKTFGASEVGMTGRIGMSSIAYNSKLYLIGGRTDATSGTAKSSVPTIFLDDNLDPIKISDSDLTPIIGETAPVLGNEVVDDPANRRFYAGAVMVQAEPPSTYNESTALNSAWVFVIGGSNTSGTQTNTLYQGKIGGEETQNTNYTPDGWYYSNVFQTSYTFGSGQWTEYEKSRIVSFHWEVDVNRGLNSAADVKLYFRTKQTSSGRCTSDADKFTDSDAWVGPIDGFSENTLYSKPPVNGALYNNVTLAGTYTEAQITGNCLQYRAQIIRGGNNSTVTPRLLSVFIKKNIAGNADINIPADGFSVTTNTNNQLSTMVMRVQNLSTLGLNQTISVSRAREASGLTADGSVYVNLCIARSNLDQPVPALTLPNPNAFGSTADINLCPYYAEIYTYELLKGTVIDLLGTNPYDSNLSRWHDNLHNYARVSDIRTVFSTSGNYRIGLILDTANLGVPEGTAGEANNQSSTIAFTIVGGYSVFLPLVMR